MALNGSRLRFSYLLLSPFLLLITSNSHSATVTNEFQQGLASYTNAFNFMYQL
jgi:hypothetical protein